MAKARLLYVMDPMCSWCWGFAPVAEALSRQAAADGVAFHLVAGGLRAGHGAALDPNTRGYILGHWRPCSRPPASRSASTTRCPKASSMTPSRPAGPGGGAQPRRGKRLAAGKGDPAGVRRGRDVRRRCSPAWRKRWDFRASSSPRPSTAARRVTPPPPISPGSGPRHRRVPDPAGRTQRPTGVAHQRLPAACRTFTLARPLAGTGPA